MWNKRRYVLADELFAADYTHPSVPDLRGGSAKAAIVHGCHATFPDLTITVNELLANEDRVAVRPNAQLMPGCRIPSHPGRPNRRGLDRR